jgi:2-polyprenyl-3-methyl-5-hydroxy-6-metoxy-1,4-benzoquinol methylase
VLDVGCNNGRLRTFLPKDIEYVGIDIKRLPGIDFTFYERSLFDNLSDLGTFDTIFLLATIEHLEKCDEAIANLVGRLNKGGVLILTTPSKLGDDLHHWGAKFGLTSGMAADDHETIFTLDGLKQLLSSHGLEKVEAHFFMLGLNQIAVGRKK